MRYQAYAGGLLAAALVACAVPAAAAKNNVLPEASRVLDGGRAVQVMVPQTEIKSDITVSNIVVATGGGLLGAMIDAKINSDRAKRAEDLIQPLRAALTGFDADALAVDTTRTALAKMPWLKAPAAPGFGRDVSLTGKSTVLDASPTGQTLFLDYAYDTSADFASVRVQVTISLAGKALEPGKKPETRLYPNKLAYTSTVTAVVTLPRYSEDKGANVAQWSANNGKLAREALTMAFADAGALIPRALELQAAEAKLMQGKDKKVEVAGGFSGRLQEENKDGKLLYNGALVHARALTE